MTAPKDDKLYSLERADGVTTIRFTRHLTLPELLGVMDEVASADDCNRRLWDVTKCFDYDDAEVRRIAMHGRVKWPEPSRVAYVASDGLAFGLLRMLEVHREQEKYVTGVFRDEVEALEWLHSASVPTA